MLRNECMYICTIDMRVRRGSSSGVRAEFSRLTFGVTYRSACIVRRPSSFQEPEKSRTARLSSRRESSREFLVGAAFRMQKRTKTTLNTFTTRSHFLFLLLLFNFLLHSNRDGVGVFVCVFL